MRLESRDLTLTAVLAALYAIINVLQMVSIGNPTIYGPFQLRLADCLIALAALLGWPVILGVTFGCFLTNAYYFLGTEDVIFGPIANFLAAYIVFLLRKHSFLACAAGSLPIGIIVGGYLSIIFGFRPSDFLNVFPGWLGMIVSITISSLIAVAGFGYLLLLILRKPAVLEPLRSHGLKTVIDEG